MTHQFSARSAVLLGALGCCTAVIQQTASAQTYTFTKIADSRTNRFDPSSTGAPSISDAGHVAFSTTTPNGSISRVFRTGPGLALPLTVIGDSALNAEVNSFSESVSVNNSGQVAVWATISLPGVDERIVRGDGGALTTIAEAGPGKQFSFLSVITSLNDAGEAAWQGELDQAGIPQGLFTGSGGAVDTLFSTASSEFTSSFAGPAINDVGQIAFRASTSTSQGDAIFRYDGGSTFTTIVDSKGPFSAVFDQNPALNAGGTVAVLGFNDGLSTGYILVGDGLAPATPLIQTGSGFTSFSSVAINNSGHVAFSARLTDFLSLGIFVGADPVNDRVIGTGDSLDGSTVSFVSLYREGLNNSGKIAFFAQLADGRGLIMVASPNCQGDLDDDGAIDLSDLGIILSDFGCISGACAADVDGDGDTDLSDLGIVLANFQVPCQ